MINRNNNNNADNQHRNVNNNTNVTVESTRQQKLQLVNKQTQNWLELRGNMTKAGISSDHDMIKEGDQVLAGYLSKIHEISQSILDNENTPPS